MAIILRLSIFDKIYFMLPWDYHEMLSAGFCRFDLIINYILLVRLSFCKCYSFNEIEARDNATTEECRPPLITNTVDCNTKNVVLNSSRGDNIISVDSTSFRPIGRENQ